MCNGGNWEATNPSGGREKGEPDKIYLKFINFNKSTKVSAPIISQINNLSVANGSKVFPSLVLIIVFS